MHSFSDFYFYWTKLECPEVPKELLKDICFSADSAIECPARAFDWLREIEFFADSISKKLLEFPETLAICTASVSGFLCRNLDGTFLIFQEDRIKPLKRFDSIFKLANYMLENGWEVS